MTISLTHTLTFKIYCFTTQIPTYYGYSLMYCLLFILFVYLMFNFASTLSVISVRGYEIRINNSIKCVLRQLFAKYCLKRWKKMACCKMIQLLKQYTIKKNNRITFHLEKIFLKKKNDIILSICIS